MGSKKHTKGSDGSGDGDDVVYARAKSREDKADARKDDSLSGKAREQENKDDGSAGSGAKEDIAKSGGKEKGGKGHGSGKGGSGSGSGKGGSGSGSGKGGSGSGVPGKGSSGKGGSGHGGSDKDGSGKGGSGKDGSDKGSSGSGGSGSGSSGSGGSGSGGSGSGSGSGGSGSGSHVPCFVAGTLIETARGRVPVETIRPGDRVQTRDNGLQPVLWAGGQAYCAAQLANSPALAPVRIAGGTFGATSDLLVSPQHRLLLRGADVQLWFGVDEVFAPAIALLTGRSLIQMQPKGGISYHHLLFEDHQVLNAQGCWSESLFPGDMALSAMAAPSRVAIAGLLGPALTKIRTARTCLRPFEARMLIDIASDIAADTEREDRIRQRLAA